VVTVHKKDVGGRERKKNNEIQKKYANREVWRTGKKSPFTTKAGGEDGDGEVDFP